MPAVIRTEDVVKALEIATTRLGDVNKSCATLRAWGAARRVTPNGQQLTVEAVEAGIAAWLKQRAQALPPKRPLEIASLQTAEEEQKVREDIKRFKAQCYEERMAEMKEDEARIKELTQVRLQEVLQEIEGHMEEVLRRRDPKAVEDWRSAPAGCDRRELYMRLVHHKDVDAKQPQELQGELLPHQVEGLEWLASLHVNNLHGILADEMGLGKTVQTIALLLHLQETFGNVGPHLVVAPKSTLPNWQKEFQRFAPGMLLSVLTGGDQEVREAELATFQKNVKSKKATVCITNYEQVYRIPLLAKTSWQLVAVDEGHRLKNPDTVIHKEMSRLVCKMRLLLTGTPIQNSASELWALLNYLLPNLFTGTMNFRAWFAKPFTGAQMNEYEVQLQPEQEQEVVAKMHTLLSPFLLQRLKSEVLADKLPPRVEGSVRVPLSAWQLAAYKDLENRTIRLMGEDESISSELVNNALMQLRKIVLHPYLFQDTYRADKGLFRASGKVEALDRILPKLLKFGHKVLVFSQFTSVLDILQAYATWRGFTFVRLDGQVSHEQRGERIQRFNTDPELRLFLLSSRAGGLGLNLQSADTVILFDLDWNPQNDKQAVARVHRVGQTREVRVIRIVSDSNVERHMEERCREKLEMEQKIMGAGMFRRQVTTEQRRQALRAVLGLAEATGDATTATQEKADLTSPEELNKLLARSEEERLAFDEMDQALLKPKNSEGTTLLERCGRLILPSEVPSGFSLRLNGDEED